MTATTTTEETSEIERFLAWCMRVLEEHKDEPEWQQETDAFFMDLYRQTYPARTFPLLMELWSYHHGGEGKGISDEKLRKS